jgi:hypothetical protein
MWESADAIDWASWRRSFPIRKRSSAFVQRRPSRLEEGHSRARDRDLGEDSQERIGPADGDQRYRRSNVALCWGWIDGIRKAFDERVVSAALHAAARAKHLEPDQSRPRESARSGRPHDAARPAAGGRREGRWTLGRSVCPDAQRERRAPFRQISARPSKQTRGR